MKIVEEFRYYIEQEITNEQFNAIGDIDGVFHAERDNGGEWRICATKPVKTALMKILRNKKGN